MDAGAERIPLDTQRRLRWRLSGKETWHQGQTYRRHKRACTYERRNRHRHRPHTDCYFGKLPAGGRLGCGAKSTPSVSGERKNRKGGDIGCFAKMRLKVSGNFLLINSLASAPSRGNLSEIGRAHV